MTNLTFEMETNKKLYVTKYEVLEENFRMLFNSIETISNAKNLEDKFAYELYLIEENKKKANEEHAHREAFMRDTIADRDYYRKETQRLIEKKLQLETEKMHAM